MLSISAEHYRALVELAVQLHDEAELCAEANCYRAACVLIGGALEGGLLAMIYLFEHELRSQELWPAASGDPLRWSLNDLVNIANQAGWMPKKFEDHTEGA